MSDDASTSRRSMLAALGVGGFGLALTSQAAGAGNVAARQDMADHPIVGSWLVMLAPPTAPDTLVPVTSIYFSDGSSLSSFLAVEAGPNGIVYRGAALGAWEAVDGQTVRQTMVQMLASAEGAFVGSVTITGFPQVSEDGSTFVDDSPDALTTVRDASHAIVREVPGGSPEPVNGYRITPGSVPFPVPEGGATPAS